MTVLLSRRVSERGPAYFRYAKWWTMVITESSEQGIPSKEFVKQFGATETSSGDLEFENEKDATAFILRWG